MGGDLSYRESASRGASPAAATLRGGPQPSNTAIRWLIQAQYRNDGTVDGGRIAVQAESGVVTLTGVVGSEHARARAVVLAERTRGVTSVQDRLYVDQRRTSE